MTKEIKPPIKGFQLSTDYERLYKLVNNGFRIPAWVYNDRQNFWDIVEVRRNERADWIFIGVRGTSYNTFSTLKENFIECCQMWELHFIDIKEVSND